MESRADSALKPSNLHIYPKIIVLPYICPPASFESSVRGSSMKFISFCSSDETNLLSDITSVSLPSLGFILTKLSGPSTNKISIIFLHDSMGSEDRTSSTELFPPLTRLMNSGEVKR